jgi:hypothetical protein
MGVAGNVASAVLGGTTTMVARRVSRRAMHGRGGEPRLPRGARQQRGFGMMLLWAAAAGVILALADVMLEQRSGSVSDM